MAEADDDIQSQPLGDAYFRARNWRLVDIGLAMIDLPNGDAIYCDLTDAASAQPHGETGDYVKVRDLTDECAPDERYIWAVMPKTMLAEIEASLAQGQTT